MTDTILDKIVAVKRARVDAAKGQVNFADLARSAFERRRTAVPNRLSAVLKRREKVNVIAEFKRASPSKGVINDSVDLTESARAYQRAGAAAISVLTEEDHFRGSLDDLKTVRAAVYIAILQKDFFIDDFQIFESAASGADAILLIVAALSIDALVRMQKTANDLGLNVIVEVHNADEFEVALEIGAKIIGVNNRDLKTFEVSLDISREIAMCQHNGALLISESGISTQEQIAELRALGYSGFLIGESLMRSCDPAAMLRELISYDLDYLELSTTQ
jgi:indole-3-glycerol phosphate synthase